MKRKQDYYSLIFIKILEARGFLDLNKKKFLPAPISRNPQLSGAAASQQKESSRSKGPYGYADSTSSIAKKTTATTAPATQEQQPKGSSIVKVIAQDQVLTSPKKSLLTTLDKNETDNNTHTKVKAATQESLLQCVRTSSAAKDYPS